MLKTIVLDTTELSAIVLPKADDHKQTLDWFKNLITKDSEPVILEVVDYEVRRGLLSKNKKKALKKLDELCEMVTFIPIDTTAMKKAAQFWAEARKMGKPTADEKSLDADAIIAAQTFVLSQERQWDVVIATKNVRHFSAFSGITASLPSAII